MLSPFSFGGQGLASEILTSRTRLGRGRGGWLTRRGGEHRPCRIGQPQRSSRVHCPVLALSHTGLANNTAPPPPTHTHTVPCSLRGRLLGARTKAPGVWRAAASPSGAPAHAPHWLPDCARMDEGDGDAGWGEHLSRAREELGVLSKTRSWGRGQLGTKASELQPKNLD